MPIGSLGSVVFAASSSVVRTFSGATRSSSSRWAIHEVIGRPPIVEYLGRGLRSLTLPIRLDRDLGVDPEAEIAALREACEGGTVLPLILGGEPRGRWTLQGLEEAWRQVDANGTLRVVDATLALQEYR